MRSAPATPAYSCCAPVRPVLARPAEALSGYYGTHWGTHGAHTYPPSELKEALDAAHGWIPASLIGLESGCEGMPGVLWVLYCPLGVLIGYSRRAPLRAHMVSRSRLRAGLVCGRRSRKRMVLPSWGRSTVVLAQQCSSDTCSSQWKVRFVQQTLRRRRRRPELLPMLPSPGASSKHHLQVRAHPSTHSPCPSTHPPHVPT
jgi:hypothetical protein